MSNKEKLSKFKSILEKYNYERKIEKSIEQDLKNLNKEELIIEYNKCSTIIKIIKNANALLTLLGEIIYIDSISYFLTKGRLDCLDSKDNLLAIATLFSGLVVTAYGEIKEDSYNNKAYMLENSYIKQ